MTNELVLYSKEVEINSSTVNHPVVSSFPTLSLHVLSLLPHHHTCTHTHTHTCTVHTHTHTHVHSTHTHTHTHTHNAYK